mgnify:CR=1 FL=1
MLVLGVYYKLQTFIYLPSNGIIQGIRPLIGYNYGAGERKRVEQIYRLTLELTAGIMAAGTALCWLIPRELIGLFTENPETITIGIAALHIISLGFILSAVSVTSSGALEALGRAMASLVISVMRYVAVIIGGTAVWRPFVCTESVTAMVAYVLYRKVWKRAYSGRSPRAIRKNASSRLFAAAQLLLLMRWRSPRRFAQRRLLTQA